MSDSGIPEGFQATPDSIINGALMDRVGRQFAYMQTAATDRLNADSAIVQNISGWMTRMFGSTRSANEMLQFGDTAQRFMGFGANQLATALARQIPGVGAPGDLFAGVQQAFMSGGTRILDAHTGMASPMPIWGSTSTAVAAEISRRMQEYYFPAANNGMPVLSRTMGLNTREMGDVMADMGARGAFAGMNVAQQSVLTSADVVNRQMAARLTGNKELIAQANQLAADQYNLDIPSDVADKIQNAHQAAVQKIAWLKKILGNMPVAQLRAEAEGLTGVNTAIPGGMDQMQNRLTGMLATGRMYGMSDIGALNFHASTAATIDQILANQTGEAPGSFSKFAAASSGMVARLGLTAAAFHNGYMQNVSGKRGEFYMAPDQADVTAMAANEVSRITAQEPELIAASYAATALPMSDKNRAALQAAIERFGNAGSMEQRMRAKDDLAATLQTTAGINASSAARLYGTGNMLAAISTNDAQLERFLSATQGSSRERNVNLYRQTFEEGYADRSWVGAVGGAATAAQLAVDLGQIPASHINAFRDALASNPTAANLEASLRGAQLAPGMSASDLAQRAADAQRQIVAADFQSGPRNLNEAMADIRRISSTNPMLSTAIPWADARAAAQLQQGWSQTAQQLGEFEPAANPITDFMTGLLGGDAVASNRDIKAYAQSSRQEGAILGMDVNTETGGLKVGAGDIDRIVAWTKKQNGLDIYGAMRGADGKPLRAGDKEGLLKILQGEGGSAKFIQAMRGNTEAILDIDTNKEGTLDRIDLVDPKMREKMKGDLDSVPMAVPAKSGGLWGAITSFLGLDSQQAATSQDGTKASSAASLDEKTQKRVNTSSETINVRIVEDTTRSVMGLSGTP